MQSAPLAPPLARDFGHPALEHLLLGDLRQLLEESASCETNRWILATLDRVLATRPRSAIQISQQSPVDPPASPWEEGVERYHHERTVLFSKLQRLRDRIAHRAPFALLANEVRCDLRDLLDLR